MTWGEFKERVEEWGVGDDDPLVSVAVCKGEEKILVEPTENCSGFFIRAEPSEQETEEKC